jgi:transposase-like protein
MNGRCPLKDGSQGRNFTAEFKARVVQRMLAGESVAKLSREVKV